MRYLILIVSCFFLFSFKLSAQESKEKLIQFTGIVLDGSDVQLYPIPYTNIYIKDKGRGTYSDFKGFFSIVVEKGDNVVFSAIGFRTVEIIIPDTLNDERYSLVQLMSQDTVNLPMTVVFPWPSRDNFKLEFLAMDVTSEMQQRALENVAQDALTRGRSLVATDGDDHADYYLRQQSNQYYYVGQSPPSNIFSPVAWKKFFDSWKNGDYKKKEDK